MSTQNTQANSSVQQHTVINPLPQWSTIVFDGPNGVGVSNNPADFPYADPQTAQLTKTIGSTTVSDPFNLNTQVRFANPA